MPLTAASIFSATSSKIISLVRTAGITKTCATQHLGGFVKARFARKFNLLAREIVKKHFFDPLALLPPLNKNVGSKTMPELRVALLDPRLLAAVRKQP